MMIRTLFAICILLSSMSAQTLVTGNPAGEGLPSTVASLPAAASSRYQLRIVTDGASASDCTVGSGSTFAWCVSNGTAWVALGGSGGGGGALSDITNPTATKTFSLFSGVTNYPLIFNMGAASSTTTGVQCGDTAANTGTGYCLGILLNGTSMGGLKINLPTASSGLMISGQLNSVQKFSVDASGNILTSGTITAGSWVFNGSTSGTTTLNVQAVAAGTYTLPGKAGIHFINGGVTSRVVETCLPNGVGNNFGCNGITATDLGTGTNTVPDASNGYSVMYSTGAADSTTRGSYLNSALWRAGASRELRGAARFYVNSAADNYRFIGYTSEATIATMFPASTPDTYFGAHLAGFHYCNDTGADCGADATTIKCTLANAAARTTVDSGITPSTTISNTFIVWEQPDGTWKFYIDGVEPANCAAMSQANKPTAGTNMKFVQGAVESLVATDKRIFLSWGETSGVQ